MRTPFFVVNKNELENNIKNFHNAIAKEWNNYIIGYSYKTNSLPWLLGFMKNHNCYAEVVSNCEYSLALHMGYLEDEIILNGPVKTKEMFIRALHGGSIINIDAKRELDWLLEHDKGSPKAKIGLRVNFDINSLCPNETPYPIDGSRFGFNYENGELKYAIDKIRKDGNFAIAGLHMHVSSKTRGLTIYKALANKVCEIKEKYNMNLEYIDMGGGYYGGLPNKTSYLEYMQTIAYELSKSFDREKTTLIIEPGASLVASAIDFVCEVIDTKIIKDKTYVITNGSRINIDPLMRKNSYIYEWKTNNSNIVEQQIICGFTCMEDDRIMNIEQQPTLQVGDKLLFKKVGAYTMCFSPLFIDYFPDVYAYEDDQYHCIRKKWGPEEYMMKSKLYV